MQTVGAGERDGVLWLIRGLGLGGAEKLLAMHAQTGDHERFRYHVAYTVQAKSHFVPSLVRDGVAVHPLPAAPWRWLTALRRLVSAQRIRVVHVHSPALAAAARLAVRTLPAARRPAVLTTEHNDWSSFHPFTRWANSVTYGWDSHTFAVSEQVRGSVRSGQRARVEVLVHGIRLDDMHVPDGTRVRARRELGIGPDQVLAVTVANFRPEKAHGDLLHAALLVTQRDPRVRFALVGQGPLADEVRALRDRLELQRKALILGARDDVPALLAAADLFVLASLWEGFPIAVMEALAAGVPVVATRVGGVTSVVEDGVQGRLVPPGSPQQLAEAVLDVVADPSARADMAAAAVRRAPDFDIRRAVGRIEDVYAELAGGVVAGS